MSKAILLAGGLGTRLDPLTREMPKVMIGEPGNVKPGGVYIAPSPSKMGKQGTEIREKVLKRRPSDDALSWPVEITKEE